MKFVSTSEFKRNGDRLVKENERGDFVVITREGKPCSILVHLSEGDFDQFLFERSPFVRRRLLEGLRDLKKGRRISLENYVHERFGKS